MHFPKYSLRSAALASACAFLSLSAAAAGPDAACKPGSSYPPSLVKSFRDGCMENRSYEKFCDCVMGNLQKEMSLYDFIEVSNSSKIEADKRFLKATGACMTEFPTAELNNAVKPAAGSPAPAAASSSAPAAPSAPASGGSPVAQ